MPTSLDRLMAHQRVILEFEPALRQLGETMKAEAMLGRHDLPMSIDFYLLVKDALESRVHAIVQQALAQESQRHHARERECRNTCDELANHLRRICLAKGVQDMADAINEAREFLWK